MAQSKAAPNLFTVVDLPHNLTEEQAEMVAKIKKYPNLKNVTYVDIADVDKVQDRGYLNFSIPDELVKTQVSVRLKRLEVTNNDKFVAYGQSTVDGQFSEVLLNKEKGLIFGTMRHEDKSYQIYGIDAHLSAILELSLTNTTKQECGSHGADDHIDNATTPPPTPESITCQDIGETTVLIMFTTAANNIDPNINQTAINAVNQFNSILNNSQIGSQPAHLVNVGVELLANHVESSGDLGIATGIDQFRNNGTAIARRLARRADIVVLLTNGQYIDGTIGRVQAINAEEPNAYAIVEVPFAVTFNFYTFTHEVGHLFGGRHQLGADDSLPAYSHGRSYDVRYGFFNNKKRCYRTIMHTFANDRERIPWFSNPFVSAGGGVTGDASCCDVARRITETAPRVSGYRIFNPSFSAYITGPDYIGTTGTYAWTPAILCGCSPYITQWVINFNNGIVQYQTTANDQPLIIDFEAGGIISSTGLVSIGMGVISCDGTVTTSFKNVTVDLWGTGLRNPNGSNNANNTSVSKTVSTFGDVFPNPISSTATFDYNLVESTQLKALIYDGFGKVVKTVVDGNKKMGYYQDKVDVSTLNSGIYYLHITTNKQSLTKKIIIQH